MTKHVIICGAGIGGLTAALALQKLNFEVTILESAKEYPEVNTGFCLWGFATKCLLNLGLPKEILDNVGAANERLIMQSGQGKIFSDFDMKPLNQEMAMANYEVHRARLQKALGICVDEQNILFDHKVVEVNDHGNNVNVKTANGAEFSGDFVIGADGIYSTVRKYITGLDNTHLQFKSVCARGVAAVPESCVPLNTHMRIIGGNDVFGAARISHEEVRWYASTTQPAANDALTCKETLLKEYANWCAPVLEVLNSTALDNFILKEITSMPPVSHWRRGRAILLGDAGCPIEPTMAMGAGKAIEDSHYLWECLQQNSNLDKALENYATVRMQRAKDVYKASAGMSKFMFRKSKLGQWWRDWLFSNCPAKKYIAMAKERMLGEMK